jgi:hypothetical protein
MGAEVSDVNPRAPDIAVQATGRTSRPKKDRAAVAGARLGRQTWTEKGSCSHLADPPSIAQPDGIEPLSDP